MKINAVSLKEENKRSSLSIEIFDDYIVIGTKKVAISNFDISVGGSRSELYFFKNNEFNFYIRKSSDINKYFKSINNHKLNNLFKQSKKKSNSEILIIAACFLFILSLVIIPIYNQEKITNYIVNKVPYSYEQKMSKSLFKSFLAKEYTDKDLKLLNIIEKKTRPLIQQIPQQYRNIKFHLSNSSQVNAYALIGGHITLTKGFLKKVTSCDELYGVVGHEIAHITKRHSLKSLFKSLSLFGAVSLLFGDVSGIAAIIIQNSKKLYSLSFSRDFELEADKTSLKYTSQIGYNADGLISFFKKLEKEKDKAKSKKEDEEDDIFSSRVKSFLSTHPVETKRIEKLKSMSKDLVLNKIKVKCDYSQIKDLLK